MEEYLLLLYDDPGEFAQYSPEEIQKIIGEYIAWGTKLKKEGRIVQNAKLKDDGGRIVRQDGKKAVVTDGPFSESIEVIGGFYLIKASSYAEAEQIAASSPHISYGGSIEVRQVEVV